MKKQIRQGVFETNSSSTHSICIAKKSELIIPEKLHFEFGEFGWGYSTLKSTQEKASYLYTGLMDNDRGNDFARILDILKQKEIEVTFDEQGDNNGYVDHSDELGEFHNAIMDDVTKLMRFLFSPFSFIITGNDNDDTDIDIKVSYEYDGYYKGN